MKIGIFGGTFNPPHIGHVKTFEAFFNKFNFDKAYVIPVFTPPHKQIHSTTSTQDRLKMTRLAFEKISDKVEVSDLEIKRQGKSYTADTIRYFKEQGCDEIYFLCGTDMILSLSTWYKPDYIFQNAIIVYARREDELEITEQIANKIKEYERCFDAKIIPLEIQALEISSTDIRNNVDEIGSKYLSPEVFEYVNRNKLYKSR